MTEKHPFIALWAHPRSMSTAFERIMRERGDCAVLHEPFLNFYYAQRAGRALPLHEQDREDMPNDYPGVRDRLLDNANAGPLFFKDMSYYVVPLIFSDPGFSSRLINVFLIRDPRRSIASYYKLDPGFTLAEVGLEAQWKHFCHLKETGNVPIVVRAEDIQADPRGVLQRVWSHAGLRFLDHAFQWQSGQVPEDWQRVSGWHGDVLASTGISAPQDDPQDRFDTAAEKAPHLRDFLSHHEVYYQMLADNVL